MLVLVHHNWIRGDEAKFARARAFDALTLPREGRGAFLRRARQAVARKAAWVYVPPPAPRFISLVIQVVTSSVVVRTLVAALLLGAVWLVGLSAIGMLCCGASHAEITAVWVGGNGYLGRPPFDYGMLHVLAAVVAFSTCILVVAILLVVTLWSQFRGLHGERLH